MAEKGNLHRYAFNTKMVPYDVGFTERKPHFIILVNAEQSETSSKNPSASFEKAVSDKNSTVPEVLGGAELVTPEKAFYANEVYLVIGVVLPLEHVNSNCQTVHTPLDAGDSSVPAGSSNRGSKKRKIQSNRPSSGPTPVTLEQFDPEEHSSLPTTKDARVMAVNLSSLRKNIYVLFGKQPDGRYLLAPLASKMDDQQFFFGEWITSPKSKVPKNVKSTWVNNYKQYCEEMSQKITWLDVKKASRGDLVAQTRLPLESDFDRSVHLITQVVCLYEETKSPVYLEAALNALNGMTTNRESPATKMSESEEALRDLVSGTGNPDLLKAKEFWLACMKFWFKGSGKKPTAITELRLYHFWRSMNCKVLNGYPTLPGTCNRAFVLNFCVLAHERGLWTGPASEDNIPGTSLSEAETQTLESCVRDAYEQTRMALVDDPIVQRVQFDEEDSMPLLLTRSVGGQLDRIIQAIDTCLSAELKEFRGELSVGTSIKNTDLKSILAQAADSESKEQRKIALEDFTAVVLSRGQSLSRELRGLMVELRTSLQTIEDGILRAEEDGSSGSNES